MTSDSYESPWVTAETPIFRRSVRQFVERELAPHRARWEEEGRVPPGIWAKAGALGLLVPAVPEQYGGAGGSFADEAVLIEELARANLHLGFDIQSIVARYVLAYGSEDQKQLYLPRLAGGELIGAIAMTEPDCGSDLQSLKTTARREGGHYVINGAKTFITNGANAGLVCLAVRTDSKPGPRALSLLLVETKDLQGFRVGRSLRKIGRHAQDTCELFFDGVRVPAGNLLGSGEGRGLFQLMEQLRHERLSIALSAVASAESAVEITARYVRERKVAGKTLFDLQDVRFKLVECQTEAHVARVFVDNCIELFVAGKLNDATAAMAKYWVTERQFQIIDRCVQMHGGYGYMEEFPIARMWADSRAQRIYAGTNEIMKEVVAWSL
ncbi:MAG: acyl-CoA dehydrogenase family protein [Rhodomicrobium sp.]